MTHENIAIVGGTGFENLPDDIYVEPIEVPTPFGLARVMSVSDNYIEPHKLYFLSRHGMDHGLAPHQINYRANIAALASLGVGSILATNAVGSLRLDLPPGALVLFDDFLDLTRGRDLTYFPPSAVWRHTDFSVPYTPALRRAVHAASFELGVRVIDHGTYVCCDGPRFESPAEIRMFAQLGGDVVGMTGLPEVVMAREAGLKYAAIGIVTNFGAGLTSAPVKHDDVVREMAQTTPLIRELLMRAAAKYVEHNQAEARNLTSSTTPVCEA